MNTQNQPSEWLSAARAALEIEAQAIEIAAKRLDGSLTKAVDIILKHPGKVLVSGIGKSGHIGQKITTTLCSTGTPAVFLHAVEAVHGDLGVYTPGDPTILISKSGSTRELVRLIPILYEFDSPLIAIVGNLMSPLAQRAAAVLDARVSREADQLGIVPTASAIVALALGDALAVALMQARKFTEKEFARYHPSGQLGRNLNLHVYDVMHREDDVAWVRKETSLRDVVIKMTDCPLGAACVIDDDYNLLGLITDGDVRRALQSHEDIRPLRAEHIMTRSPVSVFPAATLQKAVQLMEDRHSQISALPVLDNQSSRCLGLVRIHDIYQPDLV